MKKATILTAITLVSIVIPISQPVNANSYQDTYTTANNGQLLLANLTQDSFQLVQRRECSKRMGPYVTQSTAWQRYREAKSRGLPLSNGVFPCYYYGTRGYCFNIFYPC